MAETQNTAQEQAPKVDDSHISGHPNADRKNSLEAHLQSRPDRAELVDKNILPETNAAPGLQAHQKELKRHMLEDKLNDGISHRPEPEDLIARGVLQDDPRSPDEKYAEAIEDEYAKREGGA